MCVPKESIGPEFTVSTKNKKELFALDNKICKIIFHGYDRDFLPWFFYRETLTAQKLPQLVFSTMYHVLLFSVIQLFLCNVLSKIDHTLKKKENFSYAILYKNHLSSLLSIVSVIFKPVLCVCVCTHTHFSMQYKQPTKEHHKDNYGSLP